MRDFSASPTASAGRLAGATAGDIVARLIDPPAEVVRLTAGQYLRGQVLGQDEAGLLIVQTRLAIVKLALARSLPVGSDIVLQVRPGGTAAGVTVLPLDAVPQPVPGGRVEAPVAAGPGRELALARPQVAAAGSIPADLVAKAPLLRAILQSAPPLPLLAGLPSAEPGTELLLRILAVGTPAQGASPAATPVNGRITPPGPGQSANPATLAGATAPGGAAASGVGQVTPATLQSGAPAQASPQSGQAAGSVPPSAAQGNLPAVPLSGGTSGSPAPSHTGDNTSPGLRAAPQANVINAGRNVTAALQGIGAEGAARVLGSATPSAERGTNAADPALGDGRSLRLTGLLSGKGAGAPAVVHTPLGTLTLKAPVALPNGSSLALEVLLPSSSTPPGLAAFGTPWPGLEAMEDSLLSQLPAAQAEVLQRALPQAGPRLSSGILFILSAINQGNPLAWLAGPAAALDRSERGEFLDRLGRELSGLSRSVETGSGEWRLLQLPVWSDEGLRELRLFLRQQGGQDQGGDARDGDKATRFVLELEMKHYGELQLDGLVQGRKFDLILRSRRSFSALIRSDLRALFEEANAIGGYQGQLLFQSTQDWTQLMAGPKSASHSTLRA